MTKNGLTYKEGVTFREMVEYLDPKMKEVRDDLATIQNQLNNQKLIAAVVGGFMSVITTILLGWNPFKKS